MLWKELYQSAHPDVFAALEKAVPGFMSGIPVLARELSRVRLRVKGSAPVMRTIIESLDPMLSGLMGLPRDPAPLHVLMVGAFTTNTAVGRLGTDVAVFHCLEWFKSPDGARALVAHEAAHAWHELAMRADGEDIPPEDDLEWTIFSEGLATQVSRAAAPGLQESDYFWYGHEGMDDWVPWCEEHSAALVDEVAAKSDTAEAVDAFFGAGLVDGRCRVGYHVADRLVGGLGLTLPELVALPVVTARQKVRAMLAG